MGEIRGLKILDYSGIGRAQLGLFGDDEHRDGWMAYCRTCDWLGDEGSYRTACRDLLRHRKGHR